VVDRVRSDNVIPSQNEALLVCLGEKMLVMDSEVGRHTIRHGASGEMVERKQNFAMVRQCFELIRGRCEILTDDVTHQRSVTFNVKKVGRKSFDAIGY
jgi:hypothetical protein